MARTKPSARNGRALAARQRKARQATIWSKISSPSQLWADISAGIKWHFDNMDWLSYEQRCFLEEYGPALLDFFFPLPGIAFLRRLFRRRAASCYDSDAGTPLLELPDELLLMIIEYLRPECLHPWCPGHRREYRGFINLTWTHRRFRQILAPSMYKDVAILHGWCRSRRALSMIAASPQIQQHMRTLRLAPRPPLGTDWMPSARLGPQLSRMLPTLTTLRTLQLHIPDKQIGKFRKDMLKSGLRLPGIRSLRLGPRMDFMVSLCPNVESIANTEQGWRTVRYSEAEFSAPGSHGKVFVFAAGFAKHLCRFELYDSWTTEQLQFVHENIPRLQSLAMHGELSRQTPEEFLPILRTFRNLKTLVLPPVEDLSVGLFRNFNVCGNGFMGPEGRKAREEMQRRRDQELLELARHTAVMIFQNLPLLERLWIGGRRLFTPAFTSSGGFKNVEFRYEQRPPM